LINLGTVPFLNSKPLVYALEENLIDHNFNITYSPPSSLSKLLFNREIDLGLIPVAELLRVGSYSVVPNISISSKGTVDSVVLVSRKDIPSINAVAVDMRSQSSTNMLRIVFEIFYGKAPNYIKKEPSVEFFDGVDAGMIIGDLGLKYKYGNTNEYKIFDLGEIWNEKTGLPFVYAVFAVNRGVDLGEGIDILKRSKSIGIKMADQIAEQQSRIINIPKEVCLKYISSRIGYDLGEEEFKGIIEYSRLLDKLSISKSISHIEVYS